MAGGGRLGFWEVFAIGVGGMIGGGIFAVLGLSLLLSDGAAPVAFTLAGLIALVTSYSYAKLASRFPSEGGTIEYIVQGFGDGVLSGGLNLMLLSSYIVMIALYAHAFGSYGASLAPGHYHVLYYILVTLVIGALTLVNFMGAVVSGRVELALVAFKLTVLVFVAAVGMGLVDWGRLSPAGWPPLVNIVAGGMIIFLAYEGFELVANAAGDVSSLTVLRRALYASVTTVIAVYVAIATVAAGALDAETVARARDYALAVLVEPVLGKLGFTLVVAAALASTGSAINATLYGTARMSYMVAKYGQAPRILGKRVWHGAYEGLAIIALLSLILALLGSLESISTAGSGGFLLIFTVVNYIAFKLRRQLGANAILTGLGTLLSATALAILLYRMATIDPRQLLVFALITMGSFTLEAIYRLATGRRISKYIDPRLMEREKLIDKWEEWVPQLARILKEKLREVEVYLVGSIARGEREKAGDVDLLVVAGPGISEDSVIKAVEEARKSLGIHEHHPLDIHITRKKQEIKGKKLA